MNTQPSLSVALAPAEAPERPAYDATLYGGPAHHFAFTFHEAHPEIVVPYRDGRACYHLTHTNDDRLVYVFTGRISAY